jgi:hypothetical protein
MGSDGFRVSNPTGRNLPIVFIINNQGATPNRSISLWIETTLDPN